jgi:hypothetical protein
MKPTVMQKLRDRGIYSLSDGREFVVHAVFRGGYVFYTPENWERFGPYAYGSDAVGQIRWNRQPDHWRIEDLIDSGRTARSRYRRMSDQDECGEQEKYPVFDIHRRLAYGRS